jgi:uncharacterized protein
MAKNETIIGRKNELEILERLYTSRKSEFLIVYGRRRVGKTFLIDQRFDDAFSFRMSALANATCEQQLAKFQTIFNASVNTDLALNNVPKNWFDAFQSILKFVNTDTLLCIVLFLIGMKNT